MRASLIILLLAIFTMSCGSEGDKFVGKWKPVSPKSGSGLMIIEKKGKVYELHNSENPRKVLSFDYEEDHDRLSLDAGSGIIDVRYTENDHLVLSPRLPSGFDEPLEFEKAD